LSLALVAFIAIWQNFAPTDAVTLQTFAPCEDLSPHCPVLCASCIEAEKWPEASHESYEIDVSSEEEEPARHAGIPKKNLTGKPQPPRRPKRHAMHANRGWVSLPDEKPKWLPTWVPWWYKPRPHGGGPQVPPPQGNGNFGQHDGHDGHPEGHVDRPHSGEHQEQQPDKCGDLMNGGRQLVEAFCPRSCGRCGKSSSPLAAAQVYIDAQCTVAKHVEAPVGYAAQE